MREFLQSSARTQSPARQLYLTSGNLKDVYYEYSFLRCLPGEIVAWQRFALWCPPYQESKKKELGKTIVSGGTFN